MSLRRPALLSTLTRFSNPRRRNPPYQGKHAQRDQVADAIFAKLLSDGVEEKEARRRSFAIATAQLQKHGYLKPGTATPTPKGAAKIGALMRKVRRKNPDLSNADAVKRAKALVKKAEKLTQEDTSVVEFEQGITKIVNSIYDLCTKSHYEFSADEADSYIGAVRALLSVGAEVRRLRRAGKLKEAQAELQRIQAPFAWMAKKNPGSGSGRVEHLGHTITITNGRYRVEPYGVCFTGSDGFVQAKAWIADHVGREKSRAKRKNPMTSRRKLRKNPNTYQLFLSGGERASFGSKAAAEKHSGAEGWRESVVSVGSYQEPGYAKPVEVVRSIWTAQDGNGQNIHIQGPLRRKDAKTISADVRFRLIALAAEAEKRAAKALKSTETAYSKGLAGYMGALPSEPTQADYRELHLDDLPLRDLYRSFFTDTYTTAFSWGLEGKGLKKNPRRRKNPARRRNPAEGKFAIQDFRDLWFTGNSTDLKRTFTGSVGSTVKGYQTREGAQRALARLKGKLLSKGPKWGDVAESLRVVPYPAWF